MASDRVILLLLLRLPCDFGHMQRTRLLVILFDVTAERKPPCAVRSQDLQFNIETELEDDGRWIAEIPEVPGALAYGMTEQEACAKATAIALRALTQMM